MEISINIDKTNLNSAQLSMIDRLEKYDISFVLDKLVIDKRIDEKSCTALEIEFKKFIAIAGLGIYPIAMISPLVDEVWHQFILFTKHYKDFCEKTVGFFIGHLPDTPKTPIPLIAGENLRSSYRKYFGEINRIWYKGMNKETKEYYRQEQLLDFPPKRWSGWAGPEN